MTLSHDWVSKTGNDLRVIGEALVRVSRMLHEHTRKLEVAVEGYSSNESRDPRVRLLSDALHVSRTADLELGQINQTLHRLLRAVHEQQLVNGQPVPATFEREREALTTSISDLKRLLPEFSITISFLSVSNPYQSPKPIVEILPALSFLSEILTLFLEDYLRPGYLPY